VINFQGLMIISDYHVWIIMTAGRSKAAADQVDRLSACVFPAMALMYFLTQHPGLASRWDTQQVDIDLYQIL
jgi:hypothetical protein